jgi:hypothetical protein
MPDQSSRRFSLINSFKGKFFLASLAMALLTISAGTIAIFALRSTADDSSLLAEVHLKVMQDGQKLLEHSFMIEHLVHLLLKGDSSEVDASYRKILELLDSVDSLVARLGHSTSGPAILDLHQINQLFRNNVHIIARLRGEILQADLSQQDLDIKQQALIQYQQQLEKQIETMMITSNELSSRINFDYRQTIDQLISETVQRQKIVFYFTLASLILIVLIGQYFRRNTIARLQKISFYLRHEVTNTFPVTIPVQGDDEISEMARALEKLLEDHYHILQTQDQNKKEG